MANRDEAKDPGEGDVAPAFEVEDHEGRRVTSRDLRGAPYVLFFYPKADTPG
jgi:peroxiredoxin Q/BCP